MSTITTYRNIELEVEGHLATITINRPDKMNALNMETIDELGKAMGRVEQDKDVRCVVITGAGPKAFVAGADIAEMHKLNVMRATEMVMKGHAVFDEIERSSKPVIAAVNGFALGGGCELAMACHIRIAAENAKFGQPEVNLGLIPGYGGTQRLTRYVGKAKAIELMLTANMVSAQEALALGLVNHVVPQAQLLAKCRELADQIASRSPLTAARVLKLANAYYDKTTDGFTEEIESFAACFATSDFQEGTDAFLNKRKAAFTGQ